ncbi:MAG: hypothetical protein HY986_25060 [Candidatus Melainabacteria bacterium]|nr:hypothetical protein [Candidatus Melainabacteria bacterium]
MSPLKSPLRIHVLLAGESEEALVLRRGPSKQVQLIRWQRDKDTFIAGQWFKGRIYERRCDLSSSGKYFLYFAASHKPPLYSWTAVSRPPYFSALALWPKGDCWGGGGLFESDKKILLNHGQCQMDLADNFSVPKQTIVSPLNGPAGGGEDFPIYHLKLLRDGWTRTETPHSPLLKQTIVTSAHEIPVAYSKWSDTNTRSKALTCTTERRALRMLIRSVAEQNEPWYIVEYRVENQDGEVLEDLGRLDWADWDSNGDLLFAKEGRIFRAKDIHSATELIDLTGNVFEEMAPAPWALKW